jgi:hypothetical protein
MNSLTKKQTFQLLFATTILATMASVSVANADACEDALDMHRKIVSAQSIEYEKEAVEEQATHGGAGEGRLRNGKE